MHMGQSERVFHPVFRASCHLGVRRPPAQSGERLIRAMRERRIFFIGLEKCEVYLMFRGAKIRKISAQTARAAPFETLSDKKYNCINLSNRQIMIRNDVSKMENRASRFVFLKHSCYLCAPTTGIGHNKQRNMKHWPTHNTRSR